MPGLSQGVPAQVFTPNRQQAFALTANTPKTLTVPPDRIVRYSADHPVMVTLGSSFNDSACFKSQDNIFGLRSGVEAITLKADEDTTVYLEIG